MNHGIRNFHSPPKVEHRQEMSWNEEKLHVGPHNYYAWHAMVLHGIEWYCMVFQGIVWYCMEKLHERPHNYARALTSRTLPPFYILHASASPAHIPPLTRLLHSHCYTHLLQISYIALQLC